MQAYEQLKQIFAQIADLDHVQAITSWDEAVNMPPGAGESRGQALATLSQLRHERLTQPLIGELLARIDKTQLASVWDRANVQWMEFRYIRATCVPEQLVVRATQSRCRAEQAWRVMRQANNWHDFKPLLAENLQIAKEIAYIKSDVLGQAPYDVLLDEFSPGVTQASIDPIFIELKRFLPDFLAAVVEKQARINYPKLVPPFAIEKQRELGLSLMQRIGFDFKHGRLDMSHHPFCGGVPDDVRITTRYNPQEFVSAVMGICHETGHALYEQGLPKVWLRQPVGQALGMVIHESQSLLVEMQACRSPGFIRYLTPLLQQQFSQLNALTVEDLQALYSRVKPGFIRVDADEVTYPLHIILRYELERDLFNDKLTVDELPDAWDAAMRQSLQLSTQGNYRDGVMQDVHWPAGLFGYFPAYTLGALTAAQCFASIKQAKPDLDELLAQGDFSFIVAWLRENIHQHASSLTVSQLLQQATGSDLSAQHFIKHARARYLGE